MLRNRHWPMPSPFDLAAGVCHRSWRAMRLRAALREVVGQGVSCLNTVRSARYGGQAPTKLMVRLASMG